MSKKISFFLFVFIILLIFSNGALALPDLVVQSVSAPEYAPVGGTISTNVTVKNQGTNLTSGSYVVLRLIVSPDTAINLADTYYTEINIPNSNLLGGYSTSVNVPYTLPSNLTGPYYVGAYIDSWQYHAESNENNNANYDSTPLFIGPPSIPTGLSLTQITGGFRISWNNVSGATSYKIYWGTNSSVSETNYSGILITSSTPYDHTGLSSGTTYYYRIMACNSSGCSALSSIVSGLYQIPPSTPTGVSAVYQSSNNWNYITWNAVPGATDYKIYWGTSPGVTTGSNVMTTSSTAYGHSGVVAGYCYYYRVAAVNPSGQSSLSSEVSACVPPAIPTGVSVVYQSGSNQNYISWNAVAGTGITYKVYWGTSPGVTTSSNVMPATSSTSYAHTGVTAGYCYYYRVAALNSGGQSSLSSEVSACVPPATPTGLSLAQITGGFRISWNNVYGTGGTTPYKIYWGTNSSVSETSYSGILTTGSTPYDHTGLSSGTTYYYRIMACNSSGCSGLSSIVSGLYEVAPFDLTVSVDSIPPNPSNVQQGTNVSISCTVSRTGGSLPGSGQYVRVYLYLNQSHGTLTGAQEICGETCGFDFQQVTLEDGTESQSKIVTIPSNIKGPFYILAVVDGPGFWSESNENNNLSSSSGTMAIWQSGTPPPDESMGVLARTWDNPDVYWIKYGKKWPFVNQQTFLNLGYTDSEVGWYGSGALNGFALGKTILNNNDSFCYRSETDSTVYVIESSQSHPFFQWSNFLGQGFTAEDIYWAKPLGASWIESIYPVVNAPMIRIDPSTLYFN